MAWMNGVRTVYCRHCGTKGHNRRTCPSRSPEQKAAEKDTSPRSCGWCNAAGHDVRRCEVKAKEYTEWYAKNAAARERFLEELNDLGFTPGALLVPDYDIEINGRTVNPATIDPNDVPGRYVLMVDKIDFDRVVSKEIPSPRFKSWRQKDRQKRRYGERVIHAAALAQPGDNDYYYVGEVWASVERSYYWRDQYKAIVKGKPILWENMPLAWREGRSGTQELWTPTR